MAARPRISPVGSFSLLDKILSKNPDYWLLKLVTEIWTVWSDLIRGQERRGIPNIHVKNAGLLMGFGRCQLVCSLVAVIYGHKDNNCHQTSFISTYVQLYNNRTTRVMGQIQNFIIHWFGGGMFCSNQYLLCHTRLLTWKKRIHHGLI